MKKLGIALAIVLCQACVVEPAKVSIPEELLAGPTGYVAGSIGGAVKVPARNPFYFSTVYFRSENGSAKGEFAYALGGGSSTQERDFETETETGSAFLMELPEGTYEIYRVSFYTDTGMVSLSFDSKDELSLPFSVEKDKVTYLGFLKSYGIWGKNMLGMRVVRVAYFVQEPRFERDLVLLQERYPDHEYWELTTEGNDPLVSPPFFLEEPLEADGSPLAPD